MLITRITKTKNKAKLYLDNGETITIRCDVIFNNALRKGDEVNDEFISSLLNQNDQHDAKDTALRLLARRPHSKKELERKLYIRKFSKEIISSVITNLENNNYLDDEKFSNEFAEEKQKKKHLGKNRIKIHLKEKGVTSEIIDKILNERDDNEEFNNALFLAEKKISILKEKEDERKTIQRIYSYLQLKGFNFDVIRGVIAKIFKSENYNEN